MPANLGQGNCQYTALTTAGTTTLNQGQVGTPSSQPGVLYGSQQLAAGTNFGVTYLDIYVAGTATVTNTIATSTGTAGQNFPAGIPGVGVRYRGALVAVCAGTPGAINALWD